jgi:hypothetical protein
MSVTPRDYYSLPIYILRLARQVSVRLWEVGVIISKDTFLDDVGEKIQVKRGDEEETLECNYNSLKVKISFLAGCAELAVDLTDEKILTDDASALLYENPIKELARFFLLNGSALRDVLDNYKLLYDRLQYGSEYMTPSEIQECKKQLHALCREEVGSFIAESQAVLSSMLRTWFKVHMEGAPERRYPQVPFYKGGAVLG